LIRVIALNELRRRLRDRSIIVGCLAAPLAMSAVLGFSFAAGGATATIRLGVAGASPSLVAAAVRAGQLPHQVTVEVLPSARRLKTAVTDGDLSGGVIVRPGRLRLTSILVPIIDPGATSTPGFDVVTRPTSLLGQEYAESVAAGLSSLLFAGREPGGSGGSVGSVDPASVSITTQSVGRGDKGNLNFFAPSISVVFLFIGSGLGMRSLLLERSNGTLARISAAPVPAVRIVVGKLLAIFLTGLTTIFVVWGVTSAAFGANWGSPAGVLLMCLGATLAMCGIGVFLTSLAKTEQQAFGITLLVGLFLSMLGGNLLPPGSLPNFFQVLSLGTPNGWALVGFGRLAQLGQPAGSAVGPFLVLLFIAVVAGGLALMRVRRMVEP